MTPEKEAFMRAAQKWCAVLVVAYVAWLALGWWFLALLAGLAVLVSRLRTRAKGDAWLKSRLVRYPARQDEQQESAQ